MKVDEEFDRPFRIDRRAFSVLAVGNLERSSTTQTLVRAMSLEPTLVQPQLPLHRVAEIRDANAPQPLVLKRTNEPLDDGSCAETSGGGVAWRYLSAPRPGFEVTAIELFSLVRDDVLWRRTGSCRQSAEQSTDVDRRWLFGEDGKSDIPALSTCGRRCSY
jgi:hypothetical protein